VVEPALDLDVAEETDDRRQLEAERNGADFPVVDMDDLDLPLAPKRHRLLPVDDLERLVRRVQKQRLFHFESRAQPGNVFEFCPTPAEVSRCERRNSLVTGRLAPLWYHPPRPDDHACDSSPSRSGVESHWGTRPCQLVDRLCVDRSCS